MARDVHSNKSPLIKKDYAPARRMCQMISLAMEDKENTEKNFLTSG
jgi:hypothetical protein